MLIPVFSFSAFAIVAYLLLYIKQRYETQSITKPTKINYIKAGDNIIDLQGAKIILRDKVLSDQVFGIELKLGHYVYPVYKSGITWKEDGDNIIVQHGCTCVIIPKYNIKIEDYRCVLTTSDIEMSEKEFMNFIGKLSMNNLL